MRHTKQPLFSTVEPTNLNWSMYVKTYFNNDYYEALFYNLNNINQTLSEQDFNKWDSLVIQSSNANAIKEQGFKGAAFRKLWELSSKSLDIKNRIRDSSAFFDDEINCFMYSEQGDYSIFDIPNFITPDLIVKKLDLRILRNPESMDYPDRRDAFASTKFISKYLLSSKFTNRYRDILKNKSMHSFAQFGFQKRYIGALYDFIPYADRVLNELYTNQKEKTEAILSMLICTRLIGEPETLKTHPDDIKMVLERIEPLLENIDPVIFEKYMILKTMDIIPEHMSLLNTAIVEFEPLPELT